MEISTILVRKASTRDGIVEDTKELISRFGSKPKKVTIEKVIELTKEEFKEFENDLLSDRDFIKDNKEFSYFLVKEKGTANKEGIIVDTEGYDYPRYTGVLVEEVNTFKCTRCERYFIGEPAISRKDNESPVCSKCGMEEAIDDFNHREIIEKCLKLQDTANELGAEIIVRLADGYERRIKPINT